MAVAIQVALLVMLLWRRTHPLLSVAVAFGGIGLLDLATIIAGEESAGLSTMIGLIFFPYALFRWGSGRDAAIGLVIMAIPHAMNIVFYPTDAASTLGGYAFLLVPSALGASVRYWNRARLRDVDEARPREREQLARELHDTVAHHVSAIVIQAQAGRTVSDPDAPRRALEAIEAEASRTLGEMRSIVGVLRRENAELSPQRGIADLELLADNNGGPLGIDLELTGEFDDVRPSIGTAIFRIAQESITNARRHARHAAQVVIHLDGDDENVSVTVTDDGDPSSFDAESASGFGLAGMAERASLHGGTFEAGPNRGRGWTVRAVLPRAGRST